MRDTLIYEIVITNATDLTDEVIGFGDDKLAAERVFDWTASAFMREGYILMMSTNMRFIEVVQKKGPVAFYLELRQRPAFDMANLFRCIFLTAAQKQNPSFGWKYEVIMTDVYRNQAKYKAIETKPDGKQVGSFLLGTREEAIKEFWSMVRKAGEGHMTARHPGGLMKWAVVNAEGTSFFEMVEVGQ